MSYNARMRKGQVRIDPHDPDRLAERLDKTGGTDACWVWAGDHTPPGYGLISVVRRGVRKRFYTHRIAYEIAFGPIPDGMLVCHRCDNPPCANPAHLFLGRGSDNHADMTTKGRGALPPPTRRGVTSHLAKLTEDDVIAIRAARENGERTYDIAARFGLNQTYVYKILHGATWRHVP